MCVLRPCSSENLSNFKTLLFNSRPWTQAQTSGIYLYFPLPPGKWENLYLCELKSETRCVGVTEGVDFILNSAFKFEIRSSHEFAKIVRYSKFNTCFVYFKSEVIMKISKFIF